MRRIAPLEIFNSGIPPALPPSSGGPRGVASLGCDGPFGARLTLGLNGWDESSRCIGACTRCSKRPHRLSFAFSRSCIEEVNVPSIRGPAALQSIALVIAGLVLLAAGWTDRSFTRYVNTHDPLSRGLSASFWGVRLFVDLVAGLFVASLGVLAVSLLGPSGSIADRSRPSSPRLLAVVLLTGTVLVHLTQASLEWWLAPPWRPHPPFLHLIWLKAGNQAATAVMAVLESSGRYGTSSLWPTATSRSDRAVDRPPPSSIGALCWWSAWAFSG